MTEKRFYAAPSCVISTDVIEDILCASQTQSGSTETLDNLEEFTW